MNAIQGKGINCNEADNCEGVLIIQSLILSCGKAFNHEMWVVIMNSLINRM